MRTAKLQTVIDAADHFAADPDERRTRGASIVSRERLAPPPGDEQAHPAQVQPSHHQRLHITRWNKGCRRSGRQLETVWLGQHGPTHARVLGCNGDDRLPVAHARLQLHGPAAERICLALGRLQHRTCAQDQEHAKVRITSFGDAPQALLSPGAVLAVRPHGAVER
jgi:hypothetical protein